MRKDSTILGYVEGIVSVCVVGLELGSNDGLNVSSDEGNEDAVGELVFRQ